MNNIIERIWNQGSMVTIEDLSGAAFQAESGGHTFRIRGVDKDGNALTLSGTPSGVMLRADGQDVTLTCSVSGGVVTATLPANAYSVPGRFGITIFLTSDSQKTALYAAIGSVVKTSSGTVAPPAGSDVVDLINQINTAIAAIPVNYNASFAPAYSTSGLYSVGQYVTYDGNLYRCISTISSGESWTSSHWTQVALANEVCDLKSAFNYVNDILNDVYAKPGSNITPTNQNGYASYTQNKWVIYDNSSVLWKQKIYSVEANKEYIIQADLIKQADGFAAIYFTTSFNLNTVVDLIKESQTISVDEIYTPQENGYIVILKSVNGVEKATNESVSLLTFTDFSDKFAQKANNAAEIVDNYIGNPLVLKYAAETEAKNISAIMEPFGGNGTVADPVAIGSYNGCNLFTSGENLCFYDELSLITRADGTTKRVGFKLNTIPGVHYTINANKRMQTVDGRTNLLEIKNNDTDQISQLGSMTYNYHVSFVAAEGSEYYVITGISSMTDVASAKKAIDESKLQLEYGDVATAYTPYKGETKKVVFGNPLNACIVDFTNGTVTKTWKLVEYDGSDDEDWSFTSSTNNIAKIEEDNGIIQTDGSKKGYLLCDKFITVSQQEVTQAGSISTLNYAPFTIRFNANGIATTEEGWRSWLSEHPVTVLYKMAEAEIIETFDKASFVLGRNKNVNVSKGTVDIKCIVYTKDYVDDKDSKITDEIKYYNIDNIYVPIASKSAVSGATRADLSDLTGKNINWIGDSMSGDQAVMQYVCNKLGCTYTNGAQGGTPITRYNEMTKDGVTYNEATKPSFYKRIVVDHLYADSDIWVIWGGYNDENLDEIPIGDINSTSEYTLYGALKGILDYIQLRPNMPSIIFITPCYTMYSESERAAKVVKAITDVCNHYGVPVVDLHSISGLSPNNYRTLTSDGVHLNSLGRNMVYPKIYKGILQSI